MSDDIEKPRNSKISRRRMLQVGAVATATILVPGIALAADWIRVNSVPLTSTVPGRSSIMKARPVVPQVEARFQTVGYTPPQPRAAAGPARSLAMYNPHTGESINVVYSENGYYIPGALREINIFFLTFPPNLSNQIITDCSTFFTRFLQKTATTKLSIFSP